MSTFKKIKFAKITQQVGFQTIIDKCNITPVKKPISPESYIEVNLEFENEVAILTNS